MNDGDAKWGLFGGGNQQERRGQKGKGDDCDQVLHTYVENRIMKPVKIVSMWGDKGD
jgi:hypothetical protein